MRVEVKKENLKHAVSLADHVTGKNLSLPVLSSIFLLARGNTLVVRATNLEIGIEVIIPAKVAIVGEVVVSGSFFHNILTTLYEEDLVIEKKGENLEVTTQNSTLLVRCLPTDDFPTLPVIKKEEATSVVLDIEYLKKGIRSVSYSASLSDVRPEIAGIYLYPEGKEIIFAATDTIRLAEKKISQKNHHEFDGIIIPIKTALELIRIAEEKEGRVEMLCTNTQVAFLFGDTYFISRIPNGTFPDYKQIIPKDHTTEAVVLKQDVVNALKVANVFSDTYHKITIVVDPKKKLCAVAARNPEAGENTTNIPAALEGEVVEVSVNQRYLTECLQFIGQDSITLRFNGPHKAVVVRGVGDQSFLYLLMPMSQST